MSSIDVTADDFRFPAGQSVCTRDVLVNLGFESVLARFTDKQPGYRYDFGNLDLHASQATNLFGQQEILFTGVISMPRILGSVEFSLPLELESYEQGVALIAHNIGRAFVPEIPTPWLLLGRSWEEHLPGRRELVLYQRRPQCHVDADWFKVAVKKLVDAGEEAHEAETFSVSFLENVLKFDLSKTDLVMPAAGTSWTQTYVCLATGLKHLSRRTPSRGVSISVWENRLTIGRLQLQLEMPLEPGRGIKAEFPFEGRPSAR
jgi:hypothetical protein